MHTQFTKARVALFAFALGLTALGAYPAQAGHLIIEKPLPGMDDSRHDDCESRQEVKHDFERRLDHVNVSRTSERYIYKVTGYGSLKAVESLRSTGSILSGKRDSVRYVFLYDACDERIIRQLEPRDMLE